MSELCAYCQRYFASPTDLVNHLRSSHGDDEPDASPRTSPEAERPGVVCPRCGRRFRAPPVLEDHLLEHPGIRRRSRGPWPATG